MPGTTRQKAKKATRGLGVTSSARREAYTERLLRDWLELNGWICLKTDAGEMCRATGQSRRRGHIPPGTPDLIALKAGQGIAIECKAVGKYATGKQRMEHARYNMAGVPVRVIRNLDDLKKWLVELGLR